MTDPHTLDLSGMDLADLEQAADTCTGCDLFRDATQTVFGGGPPTAGLMLLGEQPGDREDLEGEPFVGPAGGLLDRALEEAGIDRSQVYVTNVVKHFRFEERGKRRIHKKPTRRHIAACRPWLLAELKQVDPAVIVCLGGSAAGALLGSEVRVMTNHGVPVDWQGYVVLPTIHPSFVLRSSESARRADLFGLLVDDLREAVRLAE